MCFSICRPNDAWWRPAIARCASVDREIEPDQTEGQRLGAKYGRRAEGTDHFIVAHVHNPEITVMPGAFTRDGQDDVRVDGGDAQVDHLKFFPRKSLAQQHIHVTARAICRLRIAHGCGFAEDKNTDCIRRFGCRKNERNRPARQLRREKSQCEILIVNEIIFVTNLDFFEEPGRISVTGQPQSGFHSAEQQQRQDDQGDETEQPFAAGR